MVYYPFKMIKSPISAVFVLFSVYYPFYLEKNKSFSIIRRFSSFFSFSDKMTFIFPDRYKATGAEPIPGEYTTPCRGHAGGGAGADRPGDPLRVI